MWLIVKPIRKEREQQAQITTQATASGTSDSSAASGAASGLRSQLASNIGYLGEQQEQADIFSAAGAGIASAQENIAAAKTFGNLGTTVFNNSDRLATLFK